jgi:hypothetical protein
MYGVDIGSTTKTRLAALLLHRKYRESGFRRQIARLIPKPFMVTQIALHCRYFPVQLVVNSQEVASGSAVFARTSISELGSYSSI